MTDGHVEQVRCVVPDCGKYVFVDEGMVRTIHGPMCAPCAHERGIEWASPSLRTRTRADQPARGEDPFARGSLS